MGTEQPDTIIDLDFKGDETNILITFLEAKVAFLNLIEKTISFMEIQYGSGDNDTNLMNVDTTGILM